MAQAHLKLVTPRVENGTVRPNRIANDKRRGREYLTEAEITRLKTVAGKSNRHGFRDSTMIMLAYRHGLRVAELVDLRWDQVDLSAGKIHVRRVKNSSPSTHILDGKEIRALRRLQREQEPRSTFVFTSERGSPFTTAGFRKMLARLGVEAKIDFPIHPHMLRHATGFKLANDGVDTRAIQDYLGHKSITNTVRYSRTFARTVQGIPVEGLSRADVLKPLQQKQKMAASSDDNFRQAIASFQAGKLNDAERQFKEVLRDQPKHVLPQCMNDIRLV